MSFSSTTKRKELRATCDNSAVLPDTTSSLSGSKMMQDMMELKRVETQVLQGYCAPGLSRPAAPVEWVRSTMDGSIMQDHKGYPLSVNRLLATKPLRTELSSRPGPGGKKLTYISGEGVTRTLNEIFGFDGWNLEIVKTQREECVRDDKGRFHVSYTAHVRLTHKKSGTYKEDVGSHDSIDRAMGTAASHALKGSITDALKRAARHFGEKLGNTLYHGDFSLHKAPLTLRDALDLYDKERAATTFGPQSKPSLSSAIKEEKVPGLENCENVPPAQGGNAAETSFSSGGAGSVCVPVGPSCMSHTKTTQHGNLSSNHSAVTLATKTSAQSSETMVAKTPSHNQSSVTSAIRPNTHLSGGTNTPCHNPQTVKPIVSATPAVDKTLCEKENRESISKRLGQASTTNMQLPHSRCDGVINPNSIPPPLSAKDRLNKSSGLVPYLSAGTFKNSDKEDPSRSARRQQGNAGNVIPSRPATSNGRSATSTGRQSLSIEWSRQQNLKRSAMTAGASNIDCASSNKKVNSNPYL